MTTTERSLPDWVEEANRCLRARPLLPPAGGSRRAPEVGDLCVAEPSDRGSADPAIVCVVEVDDDLATVQVALASPDTDLASDAHLLAPAGDTGLPFDLMISTDVTGRLWWLQVERRVGRLGATLAQWLRDACRGGPSAAPAGVRGMPVVGAQDARRGFEAGERRRLAALAADCERAVAGGLRALPMVVDPRLFTGLPRDASGAWAGRLAAVAGELTVAGRSFLPGRAVAAVVEAWDADSSRLDPDLWRAVQPCLERALAAAPAAAGPAVTFEPPRAGQPAWSDDALAETCGVLLEGGARAIRLLTLPSAWSGERLEAPAAAIARGGGRAVQLIRHNLEVNP